MHNSQISRKFCRTFSVLAANMTILEREKTLQDVRFSVVLRQSPFMYCQHSE